MFAQLLITLTLTLLVAEVLCRILLRGSVITLVAEVFDSGPAVDDASDLETVELSPSRREELRKRLGERRRELEALQSELTDRRRTAAVAEELAATEAEMACLAEELAELDGRQAAAPSGST